MTDFVLDSPGALSSRAQEFLRTRARRQSFDPGLVGDALRERIFDVYGRPNEKIVTLLDSIQRRYGGLTYQSGFFDAKVVYSPVCEPDDMDDDLEILYAVETGGPTGASVRADETVVVGLDQHELREFSSLDTVIECDSLFGLAGNLAISGSSNLKQGTTADAAARLRSEAPLGVREVSEARGMHTYWFSGQSSMVFISGLWSELGFGMPPLVKVWGSHEEEVDGIIALLRQLG
jgi:hypothetical protein